MYKIISIARKKKDTDEIVFSIMIFFCRNSNFTLLSFFINIFIWYSNSIQILKNIFSNHSHYLLCCEPVSFGQVKDLLIFSTISQRMNILNSWFFYTCITLYFVLLILTWNRKLCVIMFYYPEYQKKEFPEYKFTQY